MKAILSFLSSTNQLSSKRLAWLPTTLACTIGTFWLCNALLDANKPELALSVWYSYIVYSLILGGFVTADIIERILNRGGK